MPFPGGGPLINELDDLMHLMLGLGLGLSRPGSGPPPINEFNEFNEFNDLIELMLALGLGLGN